MSESLQSQITAISRHISNKQTTELTNAATQIQQLKQQTQQQFHLIELAFGSAGQTANMLQTFQSSRNIAPPAGSVVSLMVGSSDGQALPVANVAPIIGAGHTVSTKA